MRYHSYLNTAKKIIDSFTGAEPLSAYLKKFFAANKKYGSKDRKQIASLCYNYYRLGKGLKDIPVEERIIIATFLCERVSSEFLKFHQPSWNDKINSPIAEKLLILNSKFLIIDFFPWTEELSNGIDPEQFALSFLHQPDLFLRIRPGRKNIVLEKLQGAGFNLKQVNENCIALPNALKLDGLIELDKDAVVQDLNSQQVLNFLEGNSPEVSNPVSSWDSCAGSGGKSILLYDILKGNVELNVSDTRESILANLKKRFSTAGINNYHSFIADLGSAHPQDAVRCPSAGPCALPIRRTLCVDNCSLLLCDVPCTGSGTWSRTPEQLFYFKTQMIGEYADRQKKIVAAVIPRLQKGGLFFYITCSVFKKENEEIAGYIKENFHLHVLQMEVLKGYDKKADSMFVAVFRKP